jgi:hypothetical protein
MKVFNISHATVLVLGMSAGFAANGLVATAGHEVTKQHVYNGNAGAAIEAQLDSCLFDRAAAHASNQLGLEGGDALIADDIISAKAWKEQDGQQEVVKWEYATKPEIWTMTRGAPQ